VKDTLASKTVQMALVFAGIGIGCVLFDTLMGVVMDYSVRYIPELFALLTAMFVALAGKNSIDNYYASTERRTVIMATGQIPPNAPPQPQV
jgi:hypothetical protein